MLAPLLLLLASAGSQPDNNPGRRNILSRDKIGALVENVANTFVAAKHDRRAVTSAARNYKTNLSDALFGG